MWRSGHTWGLALHAHPSLTLIKQHTVSLPSLVSFHDDIVIFIVSREICPSASQDKQKRLDKNIFVTIPKLESGDKFLSPNFPSFWGSFTWKCKRAGKYCAHIHTSGQHRGQLPAQLGPSGSIYWITVRTHRWAAPWTAPGTAWSLREYLLDYCALISINQDKFMNTMNTTQGKSLPTLWVRNALLTKQSTSVS